VLLSLGCLVRRLVYFSRAASVMPLEETAVLLIWIVEGLVFMVAEKSVGDVNNWIGKGSLYLSSLDREA
jgi:hypothetical protein